MGARVFIFTLSRSGLGFNFEADWPTNFLEYFVFKTTKIRKTLFKSSPIKFKYINMKLF